MQYDFYSWQSLPLSFIHWLTQVKPQLGFEPRSPDREVDELLYEIEIDARLWRLIRELYSGAQCCVKTGSEMSNWFTIGLSVHQGAPMSMLLFQIFFNTLIKKLINLKIGANILNIDVPCTVFADDLDKITLSIPAMQIMVNKAVDFVHRWQLEFYVPKCSVLEYSKHECNNTVRLKIN